MTQPTRSQVHFNRPLTNLSTAYIQTRTDFIASQVFPNVPVEKQSDRYYTYTQNDWFRDEAQVRGESSESVGSGYNISTDTYNCDVWAIHKDVADKIRANADAGINVDRDATEFVTQRLLIRKERQWATDYFTTSVWDTDVVGGVDFTVWSTYATSTPITDIQLGVDTVLANTGFMPNTLVLGWEVFSQLKNHPDIRDRINPTGLDRLATTQAIMAQVLDIERLVVAKAVYATNVEGETAAYSFVHGKNALLCYSQPNPGLLRPSAGYTFAWRNLAGNAEGMRMDRFRLDAIQSDRVEGEMAFDFKVVGSNLGYFFSAAVA